MTTATGASAYPPPIENLLPQARDLAEQLGKVPSRNVLMKQFRIGAPKATALLDALTDIPGTPEDLPALRPLHLVPDPDPTPADPEPAPVPPTPPAVLAVPESEALPLTAGDGHPDPTITPAPPAPAVRRVAKHRSWPVLLLALPAFVAVWSGWVGLGELTGFGVVHPLPGIWDSLSLNTAITLPIGVESYAAYALSVCLDSAGAPRRARRFAAWSAVGSLVVGMAGQGAYHLMTAEHVTHAPWPIVTVVACLPVAVLGMGAALAHLIRASQEQTA